MPHSAIDTLGGDYAVAIHDAGAANMIAAWVAAAKRPPKVVIAQGPARAIWEQRFGEASIKNDVQRIAEAGILISGTGWASDLEHRARIEAAKRRIMSIAVVDHWVNYAMRFERKGVVQLPDAIWVGDADALRIAHGAFPKVKIAQYPNLYLSEQARAAGPSPEAGDILFLAEPARSDWGREEPGEFQALDHFAERRGAAGIRSDTPMRLRPHPSDPDGKYDDWIARHPAISLDRSPNMAAALRGARWVVGLNSAGLVIALEAGRAVICALPAHAPRCVLPHTGIIRLADL
ncbi:MAG: hypothetical protein AAF291_08955 [Pseudomonadota bacterium]